jgi:antitoxin component YwqK of YwqJK toxin-antitoxin module
MAIVPPSPFPLIAPPGHTIEVERYPSGRIRIIQFTRNGELNRDGDLPAMKSYYPNGKLKEEIWFTDGQRNRIDDKPAIKTYYPDGKLKRETWYTDGEQNREDDLPSYKEYYDNGPPDFYLNINPLLNSADLRESQGLQDRLSRQLKEEMWITGDELYRTGDLPAWKSYSPSGKLVKERWYAYGGLDRVGDQPEVKIYYPDGQLKEEIWYIDGNLDRIGDQPAMKIYYPDGPPDSYRESQVLQPRLPRQLKEERWYTEGTFIKMEKHERESLTKAIR